MSGGIPINPKELGLSEEAESTEPSVLPVNNAREKTEAVGSGILEGDEVRQRDVNELPEQVKTLAVEKAEITKEIEIRGQLSKGAWEKLHDILNSKAEKIETRKEYAIDLSPDTTRDLRVKRTNNQCKLVLKLGEHTAVTREEFEVPFAERAFSRMIRVLNALGFTDGMIYTTASVVCQYKDCKIKLSERPPYYAWEIEGESEAKIKEVAKGLNLEVMTEVEYKEFLDELNKKVNLKFSVTEFEKTYAKFFNE